VGRCGLDASGSGYGPVAGSCGHGNKHSDSIKGGESVDLCSHFMVIVVLYMGIVSV
jgi:hypothetical protein